MQRLSDEESNLDGQTNVIKFPDYTPWNNLLKSLEKNVPEGTPKEEIEKLKHDVAYNTAKSLVIAESNDPGKFPALDIRKSKEFIKDYEAYYQPDQQERLAQIQQMRDRVTALSEQLPDQAPDLNAENDITFDEEVELALKEYMTRPLHTDLIRAGVPPNVVKELESEYAKIRDEIVAGTREAAYQEMTQIATMTEEIARTEEAIDLVEQSLNDPNIGIVEMFKENRKELAINPDLLTPKAIVTGKQIGRAHV